MKRVNKLNPALTESLDEEQDIIKQTGRPTVERVSVDRNETWIIRFLHPKFGKDGNLWYARVAMHWLNKKPIICPIWTAKWLGGSKDSECPLCEAAEVINENSDDRVSNFGFKLRAQLKWRTYCLVWEKETRRSSEIIEPPDCLNVHEFELYRTTFDEMIHFVRSYKRAEYGIFDYEEGCDISVTRTAKGLRLDRYDPTPIFAEYDIDDKTREQYIKKVESGIKQPQVKIPDLKTLDQWAEKAFEAADRLGTEDDDSRGGGRRRRRVSRDEEEEEMGDDDRPRSRGRSRRSESEEGDDDRQERRSSRASRSSRDEREEEEGDTRSSRSSRSRTRDREEPEEGSDNRSQERSERSGRRRPPSSENEEEGDDDIPYGDPPKNARGKSDNGPAEEEEDLPEVGREGRTRPSTASRKAFSRSGRGGRSSDSLDEDENVAEEARDPAPPVEEEEERDPGDGDKSSGSSERASRVSSRIRDRVSSRASRVSDRGE